VGRSHFGIAEGRTALVADIDAADFDIVSLDLDFEHTHCTWVAGIAVVLVNTC
jgi:hypothetical protein